MILLDLLVGFTKVGMFSFGGGYGAVPLIRDVVKSYGWLSDEALTYMIAISESTPGPIMVNLATYVGSSQAGLLGAALATAAVVLPSFFTILLVTGILKYTLKNRYVQAVLQGLKPCVTGIILATGVYMTANHCFPLAEGVGVNGKGLLVTALLAASMAAHKRLKKKKLPSIGLILLSAVLGILFC